MQHGRDQSVPGDTKHDIQTRKQTTLNAWNGRIEVEVCAQGK